MICSNLSSIIGFECHPLNDNGTVAYISTHFTFEDGDQLPIYLEKISDKYIRFFDDGETLLHLIGRGIIKDLEQAKKSVYRSLKDFGIITNNDGTIEIVSEYDQAPLGFSKFLEGLLNVVYWEKENAHVSQESLDLIDKVEFALRTWRPTHNIIKNPKYKGVSGKEYEFTFAQSGEAILVISSNPNAISSAIKKLLDISSVTDESLLTKTRVIIEDSDLDDTAKEQNYALISRVSDYVQSYSNLEKIADSKTAFC